MTPRWTVWQGLALALACLAPGAVSADPLARAIAETLGLEASHDESLARAARYHAEAAGRDDAATDARALLRREGLADAQLRPFVAIGDPAATRVEALRFAASARSFGATHVAVGRAEGKRPVVAVLLVRRLIELAPIAATAREGQARIHGTLLARGRTSLFVTRPDGAVERLDPTVRGRRLSAEVELEPGVQVLELVVETDRGPEIAALWRWAVGMPAMAETSIAPTLDGAPALRAAIDRLRSEHALDPLTPDPRLDAAAVAHAEHTCASGIAAHVAGGVGPDARARRAGWSDPIAENIAIAASLGHAHANLLGSPSHRANLLDPGAIALGLGVARRADRACVVELIGLDRVSGNRPRASR